MFIYFLMLFLWINISLEVGLGDMHNVSGLPQVFQKDCSACFAITQTYILKQSCLNLVLKLLQSPDSEHQPQCFPRQMLFQAAPGSDWFGSHLFQANTPFSPPDIVAILPEVKDIHFTRQVFCQLWVNVCSKKSHGELKNISSYCTVPVLQSWSILQTCLSLIALGRNHI